MTECRECRGQVSTQAFACPHCGAPFPWKAEWRGTGFEWRSRSSLWGLPIVHVAMGRDPSGKLRVARGIVAVGQFAVGFITIAQFGLAYVFGVGQFIAGPVVVAQFALALVFGLGQVASGIAAVGQFAIGWYVLAPWAIAPRAWLAAAPALGVIASLAKC